MGHSMGAFELLLKKEEDMPSPDFKDEKALLLKKKVLLSTF